MAMRLRPLRPAYLFFLFLSLGCGAPPGPAPTPAESPPALAAGPMVGHVTDREARVWLQLEGEGEVRLRYREVQPAGGAEWRLSPPARANGNFTVVLRLEGLSPSTRYEYLPEAGGKPLKTGLPGEALRFSTLPPEGKPSRLRVAIGADYKVGPEEGEEIWPAVTAARASLFLWLGDNLYIDSADPSVHRARYLSVRRRALLRPFLASFPQLAIWDDHDYGADNADRTFEGRAGALGVFRGQWANPAYGEGGVEGVFFRFRAADVDFFMLDVRSHRDPNGTPDGPEKTMLGRAQLRWLLRGLGESRAPFKVIASGSTWNDGKGPWGDAWSAFAEERRKILSFIAERQISGVVLLAGDLHRGELNAIPLPGLPRRGELLPGGRGPLTLSPADSLRWGFLVEFVTGPLAGPVRWWAFARQPVVRLRPGYVGGVNFGLLEFDTTTNPPRLTLDLKDARGRGVWGEARAAGRRPLASLRR